jgi:hypothetical protein
LFTADTFEFCALARPAHTAIAQAIPATPIARLIVFMVFVLTAFAPALRSAHSPL